MIPSVLSAQVRQGIEDYLRTTYPTSTPFFNGMLERLFADPAAVFKGPYISLKLPFQSGKSGKDFFPDIRPPGFKPHFHQELAWDRLAGDSPRSTLVATGTGSGKTECFLFPILDWCWHHRGESGIKAVIIYPMNALATDQARRMARLIHDNLNLKGNVSVGLYVGDRSKTATAVMTRESVITDRDIIRKMPPDILLTNYKMLDYLMIRPEDRLLWEQNTPETLRFVVVDELHTFDGAQGTDLACLIRRLKHRLRTPRGAICHIGTSAALGGTPGTGSDEIIERLTEFAKSVFNDDFASESIIREFRQNSATFLAEIETEYSTVPMDERLDPAIIANPAEWISTQHELWFGKPIEKPKDSAWRLDLARMLKRHALFRTILEELNGESCSMEGLLASIAKRVPEMRDADRELCERVLTSFTALMAEARVKRALDDEDKLDPFVEVRYQLWMRELRRMVCMVESPPRLVFSDDLSQEQRNRALPIVNCRECGATGWAAVIPRNRMSLQTNLQSFYISYFDASPQIYFIHPSHGRKDTNTTHVLCTQCLTFTAQLDTDACEQCGAGKPDLLSVHLYNPIRVDRHGHRRGTHDCGFCESRESMILLGAQSASMLSAGVNQLFASRFNDDKKLIAFSDSVQDASHRAGFFRGRTYRFNLRSAIQKYLESLQAEPLFPELEKGFCDYWIDKLGRDAFIAEFLPADMEWLQDYDVLMETGKLPDDSDLEELLRKRMAWEILVEFGMNCRIGRTLEKSGGGIIKLADEKLEDLAGKIHLRLTNEEEALRELSYTAVTLLLRGLYMYLKNRGGIQHGLLKQYVEDGGNTYLLGRPIFMPTFGRSSRAPLFIANRSTDRFRPVTRRGSTCTWFDDWMTKCFGPTAPLLGTPDYSAESAWNIVIDELLKQDFLSKTNFSGGGRAWGMIPENFTLSFRSAQLYCEECHGAISVPLGQVGMWEGAPCLNYGCQGSHILRSTEGDYFYKFYSSDDVQRIFAREHTGLLDRDTRERLETDFIEGTKPGAPNLLSSTPTLEMGIDIGDLSSILLCSIPPKQSNYLQRIGRAGRRDGNSLVLAVANARPHDLFFYGEPKEMLQGEVEPPGCFLNAAAVLERHLFALAMDEWIKSGVSREHIPYRLGRILNEMEKKDSKKVLFPYAFLEFYRKQKVRLRDDFFAMFEPLLGVYARDRLTAYAEEGNEEIEGLGRKLLRTLSDLLKERQAFQNRQRQIRTRISEMQENPAQSQNYETELNDLKADLAGVTELVKNINEKDVYNFLTDEGLLPNYAFPEAGIELKSIILRKERRAGQEGEWKSRVYEYVRAAPSAIGELVPASAFYAEGRRVVVDQVNLRLSQEEDWRFCDRCSHMEREGIHESTDSCPHCGSILWADAGQVRRMLRLKQVMATTMDRQSRSRDQSEEREPNFFQRSMFVEADENFVSAGYYLADDKVPFGFDFLSKVTLREVNFGKAEEDQQPYTLGGQEILAGGFNICKGCGRTLEAYPHHENFKHAFGCPHAKAQPGDKHFFTACFLYREFSSEAIRILLPVALLDIEERVESFTAALNLGLKRYFKGDPGHLNVAIYDAPDTETNARRRYLVLYDAVPGGTGYLKELMQSAESLILVFRHAWDVLRACACQNDPDRDGCYRCLLAYKGRHTMERASRKQALKILEPLVQDASKYQKIKSVNNIPLTKLVESELEKRILTALEEANTPERPLHLRQAIVNNKPGWILETENIEYRIEPQADLGPSQGVTRPSRPDFVFYPSPKVRTADIHKPIAVFADGFLYHANPLTDKYRLAEDTVKRLAIQRSGRYRIWSLTWFDVQPDSGKEYFDPLIAHLKGLISGMLEKLAPMRRAYWQTGLLKNSFELFLDYLTDERKEDWDACAIAICAAVFANSRMNVDRLSEAKSEYLSAKRDHDLIRLFTDDSGEILAGYSCLSQFEGTKEPFVEILSYALENQLSAATNTAERSAAMNSLLRFNDINLAGERISEFKRGWIGFLRLMNLLQGVAGISWVTTSGLRTGIYGGFLDTPQIAVPGVGETLQDSAWKYLREISDPVVHGLLEQLQSASVIPPEAGYDLMDANGEIVAQAELAWPPQKLAVLVKSSGYYEEFTKRFLSLEWMLFDELGNGKNGSMILDILKGIRR